MMTKDGASFDQVSPEGVTELILRIFRSNGALIAAGDRLVAPLGLTSARWQILGAIADQASPVPVAQLARSMGLTRQAVQRIANELGSEGVVTFRANPRHKRAQLIELTSRGRRLFDQAMALQRPWAADMGRAITTAQASAVCAALDALVAALDNRSPPAS